MALKRYFIQVAGFDGHEVLAESPGKARWREFFHYEEAGHGIVSGSGLRRSDRFMVFLGRIEAFHHLGAA
jgi:hypothetical protein